MTLLVNKGNFIQSLTNCQYLRDQKQKRDNTFKIICSDVKGWVDKFPRLHRYNVRFHYEEMKIYLHLNHVWGSK